MNILLLGSGGREHALAWKLSQSNKLSRLYIAPGNAGTAKCGTNVPLSVTDFKTIGNFAVENKIDMLVVGPEEPLVKGIHDFFLADESLKKIPVIGPQKAGAQLEGSKHFAKKFMQRYNIPTARYQSFCKETINEGIKFLETLMPPFVLKADGPAAGKGVVILQDKETAAKELTEILMNEKFGEAGKEVVIEEFLHGTELSVFVLTDGKNYKILPSAKDYKRAGEGDTGLNTGGMGAVSPVPFADDTFMQKTENKIIIPTIRGLQKENIAYSGFIFFGLISVDNEPFVIEYNCRMGDPETEVVIPRIKSDLLDLLEGVAFQTLQEKQMETETQAAATVMLVAGGYPSDYEKGKVISGLDEVKGSIVFHAGTKSSENGKVLTNGGRVLAVTTFSDTIFSALECSYKNAETVNFDKKYYRKDIGFDLRKHSCLHTSSSD